MFPAHIRFAQYVFSYFEREISPFHMNNAAAAKAVMSPALSTLRSVNRTGPRGDAHDHGYHFPPSAFDLLCVPEINGGY